MQQWQVKSAQKLIAFLQGQSPLSGKALRRALEANACRINGKIERFGSRSLNAGDRVELAPNWQKEAVKAKVEIETVYEDDFLKIINKPSGLVCSDDQDFGRGLHLVHRLDKTTTGLLILAKSAAIKEEMIALFETKTIQKTYLAIVDGIPKADRGIKKSFLAKRKSFQGQTIWGSSSHGLEAETHWQVLARGDKASLMQCMPITGRTHQLRVHMSELGHPILVDRQYAITFRSRYFATRPLLHAHRLQFTFKGQTIDVQAPLFQDMRDALHALCLKY